MSLPAVEPQGGHPIDQGNVLLANKNEDVSKSPDISMCDFLASTPGPPLVDLAPLGDFAYEKIAPDMVNDLILRFYGQEKLSERWTITGQDVPETMAGLTKLLSNEGYRAAVEFTSIYFATFSHSNGGYPHHTPDSVQVFLTRVACLAKLNMYDKVQASFDAFGDLDRADLNYEHYPEQYPNMVGSMVPFSMHLFHAITPVHLGREEEGLDRLCALRARCQENITNSTVEKEKTLWTQREERVIHCLGWVLYRLKEYMLSIEMFESLLARRGEDAILLHHIGRVCIHLGDCTSAYNYFKRAEKALGADALQYSFVHTNRALVAMALNKYEEAHAHCSRALQISPDDYVAKNNMGVASVYLGCLSNGITTLSEMCVTSTKRTSPPYDVLLNIATMYELESSKSLDRKKELILLINAVGDSFPTECLKLG